MLWLCCLTACLLLASCEKGFLEEKPNKAKLIPETLSDFQKLLDNTYVMNISPTLTVLAGDEFYSDAGSVNAFTTPMERGSYTWEKDRYEGQPVPDWSVPYNQIFYCNVVLEGLEKLPASEQSSASGKALKGSALFYRAFAYYQLAQIFCGPYQSATAASAQGLPLKLHADINEKVVRSSLQDTYAHVLSDLGQALELVPLTVSYKNRPSRTACLSFLARVYQTMENYQQAEYYAGESLKINSTLLDYNTLSETVTSTANPFQPGLPKGDEEMQFWQTLYVYSFFNRSLIVDSVLYRSYAANDLRKTVHYVDRGKGVVNLKGFMGGSSGGFFGFANDELYLIRAECLARRGETVLAMADLNTMLRSRFKTGSYVPLTAPDPVNALTLVLAERRKSLVRRGTRWTDLKRLNLDPRFAVTLKRVWAARFTCSHQTTRGTSSPYRTMKSPAAGLNRTRSN
ncbi:RagB/SusD family nutrient uptake outer membrane protein [Pedobacter miscanthi]|uniref:RagB/SusD family nutrient uptake outer membrane protein n=1 Tax=Pedobacter miscanthi TaxID=2259170 RepID=UPI00292D8346|nr:RagB/SusD family nutrient uptake outer membrane protein [Pedobacter miscanthi]